jgi:anti-sigma28 factor (negative regulator of flagellin synthesis)
MRLTPISEQITTEIKKVEQAKKSDNLQKSRGLKSDKSEFSTGARERLSETQANADVVKTQLSAAPDIREERVEEVRKKIESGFYNSPEFIDKLADKVMNDLGFKAPGA